MLHGTSGRRFTEADRRQLAECGIPFDEAERQLDWLRNPPRYADLVRPCKVGDGVQRLAAGALDELQPAHGDAARAGRLLKFVPASGAATRMFADLYFFHRGAGQGSSWPQLLARARDGKRQEQVLVEFVRRIRDFAFHDDLERVIRKDGAALAGLADAGDFQPILAALLDTRGLDYGVLPKGLLKFHAYADGARTAFEEQLVEAADYVRDGSGLCRLHLTVSPDHRAAFEQAEHEAEARQGRRLGARFEVGYSFQKPSTDTLAINSKGELLRDEEGRLRFRPGGHGSLIENLNDLHADLVFIKNIDNVQHDRAKAEPSRFKRALAGRLLQLQRASFAHLDRIREADPSAAALEAAARFAREELNAWPAADGPPSAPQSRRAALVDRLNRPLRVCGVVPATGEPGGGPFWVRGAGGEVRAQIVEGAEVDPEDAEQQRIWYASSHFNPVDLVCGLRDTGGKSYDLHDFVDRDAVIVATKTEAGREIRALERPGLWNGAMAGWNTVFIEVPLATFSPVKAVLDLLREEHRGG